MSRTVSILVNHTETKYFTFTYCVVHIEMLRKQLYVIKVLILIHCIQKLQ